MRKKAFLFVFESFDEFDVVAVDCAFFPVCCEADAGIGEFHSADDFEFAFHLVGEDAFLEWLEDFEVPAEEGALFFVCRDFAWCDAAGGVGLEDFCEEWYFVHDLDSLDEFCASVFYEESDFDVGDAFALGDGYCFFDGDDWAAEDEVDDGADDGEECDEDEDAVVFGVGDGACPVGVEWYGPEDDALSFTRVVFVG